MFGPLKNFYDIKCSTGFPGDEWQFAVSVKELLTGCDFRRTQLGKLG